MGELRCSFCNRSQRETRKMVAGPDGVTICIECITLGAELHKEGFPPPVAEADGDPRTCSFCKKPRHSVKNLVAGPAVHICDECVAACVATTNDGT